MAATEGKVDGEAALGLAAVGSAAVALAISKVSVNRIVCSAPEAKLRWSVQNMSGAPMHTPYRD